jgi:(2Fe-2S) ferredoxin
MPAMSQFQKHLFVCTNGPYCTFDGDPDQLFNQVKKLVSVAGLTETVRVNRSGCLNQCGHGPVVVVYPEGVWYTGVRVADAAEIVSSHLVNDCPVQRLLAQLPPGNNKDTGGYPEEVHAFKQVEDELARRRLVARDEIRARLEQAATSAAS